MNATPDIVYLFEVEYEDATGKQWHTVVDATSIEAAKEQFRRDNPSVELLSIKELT